MFEKFSESAGKVVGECTCLLVEALFGSSP